MANNKFEFIASKDFQNFKEDESAREKKREKKENIIIIKKKKQYACESVKVRAKAIETFNIEYIKSEKNLKNRGDHFLSFIVGHPAFTYNKKI